MPLSGGAASNKLGSIGKQLISHDLSLIKYFDNYSNPDMLKFGIDLSGNDDFYKAIYRSNFLSNKNTVGIAGWLITLGVNSTNSINYTVNSDKKEE